MKDKNGVEITTGCIVVVEGAFLKRHNGRHIVTHSPGDENWTGMAHCMCKIKKNGEPFTMRYRINFWPPLHTMNDWKKKEKAEKWDAEHATIEVIGHMEVPEELL